MGIFGLLSGLVSVLLFFLRKNAEKKTPNAKSKKDIEEFDNALVHGDADNVALEFDELFQDADRYDSGQHEANQDEKRPLGSDRRIPSKDLSVDENL